MKKKSYAYIAASSWIGAFQLGKIDFHELVEQKMIFEETGNEEDWYAAEDFFLRHHKKEELREIRKNALGSRLNNQRKS